jgi:hypothetical protein
MTNRQVLVQVIAHDYYLVDLAALVHLIQQLCSYARVAPGCAADVTTATPCNVVPAQIMHIHLQLSTT